MTMFDPFDLRAENKVYQRACQIMAKELIEYDLLMEAIWSSGDPDAHVDIPGDLTDQIELTVQDYLDEARKELNETICTN
jgi:hypothetical protein